MKYLLTNAHILKNANPNDDILVFINACKEWLGGPLMQHRHVIWIEENQITWKKLCYPWVGAYNYYPYIENVKKLSYGMKFWAENRP